MNKKISIELTQEEYDALAKAFDAAKNSKLMPTKSLNIDDFVKEIVITFAKGPNLDALKNVDPSELANMLNNLGDLGDINNLFDGNANKPEKKEDKKDEIPDEQKYKS